MSQSSSRSVAELTSGLKHGDYFRDEQPKKYDAKPYFDLFDDWREACGTWSTKVLPRMLASKNIHIRRAGIGLQKKWAKKTYRKALQEEFLHAKNVLRSVRQHQGKILDHSLKDLCHTLQTREDAMAKANSLVEATEKVDGAESSSAAEASAVPADLPSVTKGDCVEEYTEQGESSQGDSHEEDVDSPLRDPFTDDDRRLFSETFLSLQEKLQLPSGKFVEDIIFAHALMKKTHHLLHSFIIDVDDEQVEELFTQEDWDYLTKEQEIPSSMDDEDVRQMLDRMRDEGTSVSQIMAIINEGHPRLGATFNMEKDYDLKWIRDAASKWVDLYAMPFNVFSSDAPLEYFWRSQVWGVLDTLFFDVPSTLMVGGESIGIESTERCNIQRATEGTRKLLGSKSDGYLRMFGPMKSDWLVIEGAKGWDPFAAKYRREASWKIGREMHDIYRARTSRRTADGMTSFRTYGVIFGGPTIQLHVMSSLGGASTILRRRPPLSLASSVQLFEENITILEVLLLLKKDVLQSLRMAGRKNPARDLFTGKGHKARRIDIPHAHRSPKKTRRLTK